MSFVVIHPTSPMHCRRMKHDFQSSLEVFLIPPRQKWFAKGLFLMAAGCLSHGFDLPACRPISKHWPLVHYIVFAKKMIDR